MRVTIENQKLDSSYTEDGVSQTSLKCTYYKIINAIYVDLYI